VINRRKDIIAFLDIIKQEKLKSQSSFILIEVKSLYDNVY